MTSQIVRFHADNRCHSPGDGRSRTSVLEQFRDAVERIDDLERRRETAKQDVSPLIKQLLDDISREAGASEPDRKADAPTTERSAPAARTTDAHDTNESDTIPGDGEVGRSKSEGTESKDDEDPPSMFELADDP